MKDSLRFFLCFISIQVFAASTDQDDWGDWALDAKPLPAAMTKKNFFVGIEGDDENLLNLMDQSNLGDEKLPIDSQIDNEFDFNDNIDGTEGR